MTRKTQDAATTQDPVTVCVRCFDEVHRVTWRDHRLVLEDHSDNAVKMMDLLDTSCGCMKILREFRRPMPPYYFFEGRCGFCNNSTPALSFLEHIHSPRHRQRVLITIARVYEVDLPDPYEEA